MQILEVTCLQSLIWDQVLMLPHLHLRVIYQALQVIWQVGQNSDQEPLLLIWDQGQWDLTDHLQAWIWMEMECLRHLLVVKGQIHYLVKVGQLVGHLQEIQADLLLVWIWMETECPLHRQVDLIWDRDQTMDMDQTRNQIILDQRLE